MERETRKIKIGNHSVELKTYATARETQAIQGVYYANAKIDIQGDSYKVTDFNPAIRLQVEKEMIAQLVVSIDGNAEDLVEKTLDWKADEYSELVAELDSLTAKKK